MIDDFQHIHKEESSFNFKQFLFEKILHYWYFYTITIVLALFAAHYYIRYSTPVYTTSMSLFINFSDKKVAGGPDFLSDLGSASMLGNIDNEIEVIKSRNLLSRTIQQLDFNVSYFLEGDLKTTELYKHTPILLEYDTIYTKGYGSPIHIKVLSDKKYELSYDLNNDKIFIKTYLFGETILNEIGEFKITIPENSDALLFRNPTYEKRNFIVTINNMESLVGRYASALSIENIKNTRILELTVEGPVPQKSCDFLNKLAQVYLSNGVEQKNEDTRNTLKFIDDQIALINKDLDQNETSLEEYKTNRGFTDIADVSTNILSQAKSLQEKISSMEIQISFLNYLEKYVKEGKSLKSISPSGIGIEDQLLQKLITDLSTFQSKREAMLGITKRDNPMIKSLESQIQTKRGELLENIKSIKDGINASKFETNNQLSRIEGKIKTIPKAEKELTGMKRQATITEGLYVYLLQKRAEAAILLASTISDSRVIDSARTAKSPIKPIKSMAYSLAILLGILIDHIRCHH